MAPPSPFNGKSLDEARGLKRTPLLPEKVFYPIKNWMFRKGESPPHKRNRVKGRLYGPPPFIIRTSMGIRYDYVQTMMRAYVIILRNMKRKERVIIIREPGVKRR